MIYFVAILLYFIGLFQLFSIAPDLFWRQLIIGIFGVGVFFGVRRIPRSVLLNFSPVLNVVNTIALLLIYLIGLEIKGSRRWLTFSNFSFQPSEIAKIIFILLWAQYFATCKKVTFANLSRQILFSCAPLIIIFLQPDLGTTLVFVSCLIVFLFTDKVPRKFAFGVIAVALLFAPIIFFSLRDYQRARIVSFMNPTSSSTEATGYNRRQSIIAVGSGQVTGRGIGYGKQSKLAFLPEAQTDFAFAALVEQTGLIGGGVVLVLCAMLLWGVFTIALRKHDYVALGVGTMLATQMIINIGMNIGLLPITGIPLPFISYGGSSLLAIIIGLALL